MGFGRKQPDITDQIFEMKFAMKELNRSAKKADKDKAAAEKKVSDCVKRSDDNSARLYATTAIRKKKEAFQYRSMVAHLDTCIGLLEQQATMASIGHTMGKLSHNLSNALSTANMTEMGQAVGQFIGQLEDVQAQSMFMDQVMSQSAASAVPLEEVDTLIQGIAAKESLEFKSEFATPGTTQVAAPEMEQPVAAAPPVDPLAERFNNL
ncbi:putative chromatin modifying protein 1b [Carpediemonas membranifera]|uniref:Putative chromatin modifying protein 1b n=1 Tax=Carpediemonas membranifera TaxID=201153 RepID=A0A8J6AXJ0_9EUKA|nr:putative chromatin modifying protein 1b [Carpediemonas membranifera]QNO39412.1 vacuolar protein sorting 46A [Carpediemonas membranifera]|eukprot:KAG9393975.1 putative chromatin modifying protein 1b [Carpediemonas membranifera]